MIACWNFLFFTGDLKKICEKQEFLVGMFKNIENYIVLSNRESGNVRCPMEGDTVTFTASEDVVEPEPTNIFKQVIKSVIGFIGKNLVKWRKLSNGSGDSLLEKG